MELGLGTVQFGLDYGMTNAQGRISPQEVEAIIELAGKNKVRYFDTAAAYGDSEKVLGRFLPRLETVRLITKTPKWGGKSVGDWAQETKATFSQSLKNLGQNRLYGLLAHSPEVLLGLDGETAFKTLSELKNEGLVQKIGVSVYDAAEVEEIFNRFPLDLVQIPLNVLDQRLPQKGVLKKLKDKKVEIHARSLFLQGILLEAPEKLGSYFEELKPTLLSYRDFLKGNEMGPLEGALQFAESVKEVDVALVGVASLSHFEEILQARAKKSGEKISFENFGVTTEKFLDPRRWPVKK